MSNDESTYIGDGVTVSSDGWQLRLSTPRDGSEHVIYLDPSTYLGLRRYAQETGFEVEMAPRKRGER